MDRRIAGAVTSEVSRVRVHTVTPRCTPALHACLLYSVHLWVVVCNCLLARPAPPRLRQTEIARRRLSDAILRAENARDVYAASEARPPNPSVFQGRFRDRHAVRAAGVRVRRRDAGVGISLRGAWRGRRCLRRRAQRAGWQRRRAGSECALRARPARRGRGFPWQLRVAWTRIRVLFVTSAG